MKKILVSICFIFGFTANAFYQHSVDASTLSSGQNTSALAGANMRSGFIDATMIQKEIPDYRERMFYISGPHGMVTMFEKTLSEMGIPRGQIKPDFFPRFA